MARTPVKVAKLTICNTHIGSIAVAVYDPGDHISRHMVLSDGIACIHEFGGWSIFKQEKSFLSGEKLQVKGFLQKVRDVSTHKKMCCGTLSAINVY
jgi:hypothetical protein